VLLKKAIKKRFFVLFTCCLVGITLVSGQEKGLTFHRLNQGNGLSQGTCSSISRDSRGFVWLSTLEGLNRFDGQSVKVYRPDPNKAHSMLGNIVTSPCYEDAAGDLWFTTYNAVHRYVRHYDYFEVIQLKNKAKEDLTGDYYAFYLDSAGRLWLRVGVGNQGDLHVFDTKTRHDSIVCPLGGYRSIVVRDKAGAVKQILSSEFPIKIGGLELTDLKAGFKAHAAFRTADNPGFVHEAFQENDTLIWLGLSTGIASFNPETGQNKLYSNYLDKPLGDVWSLRSFRDSLVFAASLTRGLLVFNKRTEQFTQQFVYEPENPYSLQSNETRNLLIDDQENLWVSQWNNGVSFVNLRKQKFLNVPELRGNPVSRLFKGPDGNVWCNVSKKGMFIYSPAGKIIDTLTHLLPDKTPPFVVHKMLKGPNQNSIFYSTNDILDWDAKKRVFKILCHQDGILTGGLVTQTGNFILTSRKGIFEFLPAQNKLEPVAFRDSFAFKSITSVFIDKRGLWYVSDNSDRFLVFEKTSAGLVLKANLPGLGNCKSYYEMPDGSGILVAATVGLIKITPDLQAHLFNELSDGLPAETYYCVLPDHKGKWWLSSNNGMLCYDPVNKSYHRYNQSDGLFGNEFNTGSWFQDDDGTIWAGGQGGMIRFKPEDIRDLPYLPQVALTQILVNDEPFTTTEQVAELSKLDLPFSQNTLSFEFAALDFSDPASNQFQYRLVGYDRDWVKSGTRGFARYANLPPGHYILEILAANSDGVWSTIPKSLLIHIQTPFYKTWWFYLLCLLAISGLIYAWFQYRLAQVLKIERMRVQISSDLHDDVGTLLSGLAMQSEVLELTASEKDKGKLRRIGEISRDAMARMRDTVWAIDARKDKFENLLDRMREHAEETLGPRGIRYDIEAEQLSLKQNLPTNVRQNVYLIYKEAITNAAKHSNGDTLRVTLKKAGSGFEMRIWDNGKMPEKAYKTTGSGTSNMQMRAEKIGGTLEICRTDGFEVLLKLKDIG
jgi:ligand-binding sensor domain-containing protein/two-component sensor histidine kinase